MTAETCTTMKLTIQDTIKATNHVATEHAVRHGTCTYTCLATAMGRPTAYRQMGYLLDAMRDHCIASGWPSLTALVVSEDTGLPSWREHSHNAFAEMTECFTFFGRSFNAAAAS